MMFRRYNAIAVFAISALLAAPSNAAAPKHPVVAKHAVVAKKAVVAKHAVAAKKAALNEAPPVAAQSCDRADFRLLLDVGHTLEAAGAISARGIDEYQFNLTLTKELASELRKRGFDKTMVMITQGPTRPGLMSRVAQINKVAPDLLLSIHHDSVPDAQLEQFEYDNKLRSFSDRYAGHSIFVSAGNPRYAASLLFAHTMGMEMEKRDLHYTPHYTYKIMGERQRVLIDDKAGVYRYDQLLVLKNTHVPSVLLEAGSIINREEEWKLHLPKYREPLVAAIADAVDLYCRYKPPASRGTVAAKPSPQLIVNAAPPARPVRVARKAAARKIASRINSAPVRHAAAAPMATSTRK